MWEIVEAGAIIFAIFTFIEILFHNPIRTTEEWDQDEESDKKDEK